MSAMLRLRCQLRIGTSTQADMPVNLYYSARNSLVLASPWAWKDCKSPTAFTLHLALSLQVVDELLDVQGS
jgi:hypothetical protein